MSKETYKKVLLVGLLLVFIAVVVKQFVFSDDKQANEPTNGPMTTARARSANNAANRPIPRQQAQSVDADSEQGYRPLPLEALRRRSAVGKDADRNVFIYYVPPPPPPPVEPPKPPPPITVHSVDPSFVFAKTRGFTLRVFGEDFPEDVQIFVRGMALKTTRVSGSELSATLEKRAIAIPGQLQVEVKNASGTLYSNPFYVPINEAPPPAYTYVGRIDNSVYLQRGQDAPLLARLGQTIDNRWRVAGVSSQEVVLEDIVLEIPYTITMEEPAANVAGVQPMVDFQAQPQRFVNPRRTQRITPQGVVQPQPEPNPSDEEEP